MEDPRLLVAVSSGLTALAAEARRSGDQLGKAEHEIRTMRRELASINAVLQEESSRRLAEAELGPPRDVDRERSEHAFDHATGLYDERYFAVLVQQHVAAARRSLRPVSVVIFEIDSMSEADADTRQQALGVVGDVVRRTLRESDAACRLGDLMVGAILEDTPEAGAVWAAERVRGTLLASPVGDALTLSAGVACYPTHALGAAELVHQASRALEEARARGRDRVELAPEATN